MNKLYLYIVTAFFFRELIADTFSRNQAFVRAQDKACTAVINHRLPNQQAKDPELLAIFTWIRKIGDSNNLEAKTVVGKSTVLTNGHIFGPDVKL